MKKFFLILLMATSLILGNTVYAEEVNSDNIPLDTQNTGNTENPENPAINDTLALESDSAILIDATTGEVLYDKNSHAKKYPASITKLMTVLLAMESDKMNETITFSHEAIFGIEPGSSHIAMDVGEEMTMEQAMYAIILRSANEVSAGVAEQVDGSIDAFANHMTARAKELGALDTNFVNANGLHDENHYTTAYDMALIAKELLKFDNFRELIGTLQYDIPPTNKQSEVRHLYSQHQMIKKPSIYYYEWAEGGKTGFTNEAQNTLVTYAKQGDTELIAVVFNCKGAGHYVDSKKLFDYGFENYKTVKLLSAGEYQKTLKVIEKQGNNTIDAGKLTVKNNSDIYKTVAKNMDLSNVSEKLVCDETVIAPIEKGAVLGSLVLSCDGTLLTTIDLATESAITVSPATIKKEAKQELLISRLKIAAKAFGISFIAFLVLLCITRTIGYFRYKKRRKLRQSKEQSRT